LSEDAVTARAHAHAQRLIDAQPEAVYAVLADYTTHHPRIMPASLFSELEVEKGGVGEGTVFHITLHTLGKRQRLHMQVGEPEPGRVLTEKNLDTGLVTEFRVAPGDGAASTLARISSEWTTDRGVRGWLDRLLMPQLLRLIFARQLGELDNYMGSTEAGKR